MSITVFPVFYVLPIRKEQKVKLSRKAVQNSFKLFIGFMKQMGVLSYEVHGMEKLKDSSGKFIIANHPTLIDVVYLIAFSELPNCVIKNGVWNNPFMYFVVRASGFIENSAPEDLLNRCVSTLDAGDGLILFPEGTRTDPNGDIIMSRGCAHIALRSQKDLTPVSITCTPITLTKRHKWYNIPLEKGPHFCLKVQDDIEIKPFLDIKNTSNGAAKLLTEHIREVFIKEIS